VVLYEAIEIHKRACPGRFAAGLVVHGPDGHDHVRLQLLDSTDHEPESVVCDSSFATALKRRFLEDRARVCG
jgi:hypothetical protein